MLFLCFIIGLLLGLVFVNIVCVVFFVVELKYKEFCLGLVIIGELVGVLVVSFVGFVVELVLRKYCNNIVSKKLFCYIRFNIYKWILFVCFKKG